MADIAHFPLSPRNQRGLYPTPFPIAGKHGRLVPQRRGSVPLSWNHTGTDYVFPRPMHAARVHDAEAWQASCMPSFVYPLH